MCFMHKVAETDASTLSSVFQMIIPLFEADRHWKPLEVKTEQQAMSLFLSCKSTRLHRFEGEVKSSTRASSIIRKSTSRIWKFSTRLKIVLTFICSSGQSLSFFPRITWHSINFLLFSALWFYACGVNNASFVCHISSRNEIFVVCLNRRVPYGFFLLRTDENRDRSFSS